jgi:hypothetical protein
MRRQNFVLLPASDVSYLSTYSRMPRPNTHAVSFTTFHRTRPSRRNNTTVHHHHHHHHNHYHIKHGNMSFPNFSIGSDSTVNSGAGAGTVNSGAGTVNSGAGAGTVNSGAVSGSEGGELESWNQLSTTPPRR